MIDFSPLSAFMMPSNDRRVSPQGEGSQTHSSSILPSPGPKCMVSLETGTYPQLVEGNQWQ